ncbi:MAG: hypothetical protein ACPL7K_08800 [Armatimonadota bacterium]
MTTFNLSIEEVAFALGYVGGADTAAGFLSTLIGQRSADELAGRLTAAGHSLIARGLLVPAPASPGATLASELRQAAESMVKGDNVLRVTVTAAERDQVVTFFMSNSGAIRHELNHGVVSELVLLPNIESVQRSIANLIAPDRISSGATEPVGRMNAAQLRELRQKAGNASPAELASWLAGSLPFHIATRISTVMSDAASTWSATLQLVTNEIGSVESNRGIFTVFMPEEGWLFDMSNDPSFAEVYLLDRDIAASAVGRLMKAN